MIRGANILNLILICCFIQCIQTLDYQQSCPNYYWYFNENFQYQQMSLTFVNQYSQKENIKLGLGLWFSYRSLDYSLLQSYQQIDSSQNIVNFFLLKFERFGLQRDTQIFSFIEMNQELNTIEVVFYIKTLNGYQRNSIQIDNFSFDGDWNFIYFYINQELKTLISYYFSNIGQKYFSVQIDNFFQLETYDALVSTYAFYLNENIDGMDINTNILQGIVKDLIVTNDDLFQDFQNFSIYCLPLISCFMGDIALISNNNYLSGLNQISTQTDQLSNNYYKISGWVKQQILSNSMKLDSLLLRITTNQYFFDDNQIGDKLLYVLYHQNQVLSQNGFTFQTYSYDFPIKQSSYTTQLSDIIYTISSEYAEIQTDWHFFYYIEGSIEKQGQPFIRIYYPKKEKTFDFQWKKDIHHYTNVKLFFHFGGDDYIQNQFKGYLSDWNIEIYCQPKFEITVDIPCHYSCLTCKGIFENDCLSCDSESKRIFSNDENKCVCPIPYIDLENHNQCQLINNYKGYFETQEEAVVCTKIGFYQCDSEGYLCDYGYFKYNDQCVECPLFSQIPSKYIMSCPDCYIYPEQFSKNPLCSFSYISQDNNSPFIYYINSFKDQQNFQIMEDDENNYFLQLRLGSYVSFGVYYCKPGYYQDTKKKCKICPDHCSNCQAEGNCQECAIGYYMNIENQCEPCKMCHACQYDNGEEFCFYQQDCVQSQYWFNNKCYDCGENCLTCSVDQCFQCIDNQKYYLTLDKINCALCPIQNCKYCFEYFMSNQGIIVSFDIDSFQKYSRVQLKIIVGCAQCSDGFFYSQQTQECIQRPIDQNECQVGVILNNLKDPICLKSQTLLNSIQSLDCNNNAYCLECIKNYSQSLQSFCIVCQEGYYSTILTGQCKLCPVGCRTCAQQLKVFQDFWKWEIKAFYKLFVNSDGSHSFEENAVVLDQNQYEITCLSCSTNSILHQNKCIDGCDENCIDCRVQQDQLSNEYYSQCFQCKSTIYNKQRGLQFSNRNILNTISLCLKCSPFCEACHPRTKDEIFQINPFFDQLSKYLFYTNICYKYKENQGDFFSIIPSFITPQTCQNSKKCQKIVNVNFLVFCDTNDYYNAKFGDGNKRFKDKLLNFYDLMIVDSLQQIEIDSVFDYLNQNVIQLVNYRLNFQKMESIKQSCSTDQFFTSQFSNQLRKHAFYVKSIKLEILSEQQQMHYTLSENLIIINFDKIHFKNFNFFTPLGDYFNPTKNLNSQIEFQNDYVPQEIIFENCNFFQFNTQYLLQFQMISNLPKTIKFLQMELNYLQIINSIIFNFQPQSEQQNSFFQVQNLIINKGIYQNTSIFSFQAENNSLNYQINMTFISLYETQFKNSIFLNSSYYQRFDIGVIYLENLYLKDVIFQDNSIFIFTQAAVQIYCKNITINNVKFLDKSSFFVGNTFQIDTLLFLSSYIEIGYFITNIGEISKSSDIVYNSNHLSMQNVTFDNITYISENTFIFIQQQSSNQLELRIENLKIIDSKYISLQLGQVIFNHISYKNSLIYLQCAKCFLRNIYIIRGYGRPEMSIVESQYLILEDIYISLNQEYYQKSLHSNYRCIQNLNILDMHFVIFISSYHYLKFDNIKIEDMLIFDHGIIQIEGQSLIEDQNSQDQIIIQNGYFQNNILIITQLNKLATIISVSSKQNNILIIENMQIKNNILNKYEDDAQMHSSGTFLIELQVGQVTILNSIFSQNAVYNSTDSILFIKTSSLILENCTFQDSNIFNAEVISKNILLQKIQHYDLNYTLQTIFSIQSQGGSGYFVVNAVEIRNTLVNNTWAVNGGAFYIITGSNGQVLIRDSYFSKSQTILAANSFSSGGAVYIDSTKSQLKLEIQNTMFLETYSRTFGGVIYIDASKTKNAILINNSTFISCFSFQHSVLSFSPSQIQQQKSEILISNCYFRNPQINYELYVSQIQDFTDINIETFQFFNPLIYSQNCYLIVYNCTFQEIHIANILQIEKGINVKLEAIRILNCTISYNSLISITNRENFNSVLIFKDFVIMNVREFFVEQNYECQVQPQDIIHEILCPNQINDIIQKPLITNIQINQSPNYCSLKKLYNRQEQKFSLIVIKGLSNDQIFEVENFLIQNNICNTCYYGLINFATFSYLDNNLIIKYLQVQNNICGFLGCISIFQEYDDIFLQNQNLRLLTEKIFMEYNTKFQIQVKLIKSSFINNTASYGAACFFAKLNIFIQDCFFHLNFAQEKGGAIYFYSEGNEFLAINSEIIENQAQIAGGLYINQSQVQQLNQFNFLILDNEAKSYADNLLTQPSKLKIRVNGIELEQRTEFQNLSTLIDIVRIKPYQILGNQELTQNLLFPSGIKISSYKYFDSFSSVYIPYNFSFRLIALNQKNEQIIDLKQSSCQIFTTIIYDGNFSISQFQQTQGTLSQYQVNFNSQTGDYNLDDLIIYFNPKLENTTELQLAFQCNQIRIPQYNPNYPYELQNIIDNYILVLKLKTFECQLGEYLNVTSGGCVQCDVQQNQYSITKDAIQCEYKDELKMKNITSAMIELREGFWRAFYDSRIVEECYHLKLNCLGGWIAGDPSCNIGHIGALCEQCDIYNIKGLGSYSQSQNYSCSNCTEMAKNIITIILAFIWTLLSIFLSVNSTIKMIDEFIIYTKLRTFGKFLIFKAASISILIKVFTNYLQIISSLSTFQLAIPIGITLSFQSIGNPIESMSFSLDCYFVQFHKIEIIYIRIIWIFIQVGLFISIFLMIHLFIIIIQKKKMSLTYLTTTLIYVYIYLSPNIVSGLVALMSYRTISEEKWVTSNVSYLYQNSHHLLWLFYFILPAFVLVSIIIPFFFFIILYNHRKTLHLTKIRKIWGYLYNEYHSEVYYWEIIKIFQKELIILVLVYYVDYVSIKSSLIFFILYLYGHLSSLYKPYQSGSLNYIDQFQTNICKISIILAQTIYSAQNLSLIEIQGPFYVFLTIFNLIFIVQIVSKIFFAYFDKLQAQIDFIKAKIVLRFPHLIKSNKFCQNLFQNTTERKQLIRQRFLLIKGYLLQQAKQILEYKKLNNIDNICSRNSKDVTEFLTGPQYYSSRILRLNTARTSKQQLPLKSSE